jgi:lysine 2,3-aminomutase
MTGKKAQRTAVLRSAADLADAGLIEAGRRAAIDAVASRYSVAVSPGVAALIDPHDAHDPIARQFVPHETELMTAPEEHADPIGDDAHSPVAGIVHRYPDRVLFKLVHVCPVYCRFCFRREMVGTGGRGTLSAADYAAALDYIRTRDDIWEVILTGGDPLILSARRLKQVMHDLAAIPHVKIVRVHSRVPVVTPERVTREMVRALKIPGKATYLAVHVNHARELSADARAACARFVDGGIPVLSQTVLLKGVNDDAATMEALMRALVECRIKPYYLHHGDLAPGTSHLRTDIADGQTLMRNLRGRVSGLCQPTYVLDIPGGAGKVPVGPAYLRADGAARYAVEDPTGATHAYPPAA